MGETPFVQVSMTWACPETVHQRETMYDEGDGNRMKSVCMTVCVEPASCSEACVYVSVHVCVCVYVSVCVCVCVYVCV